MRVEAVFLRWMGDDARVTMQWRWEMNAAQTMRTLGAGGLLAVAAVHANWARGAAWPAPDRHTLADAVIGRKEMPGTVLCLAVAGMLTVGAALVAGEPRHLPRLQRFGAAGVVATLALRGAVGFTGVMDAGRMSPTFARWNRRVYSPLCLALAALCAGSTVQDAARA